ncbi:MAG: AMP-binding protein [Caulobacterales bacterium]
MADSGALKVTDLEELGRQVNEAAQVGMQPAMWARLQPDRVAIYDHTGQDRTFGELNANANRVARLLRAAGLVAGDSVALACGNRAEFCDVLLGVLRVGMRCTPVNWHLTADEIAYVVQDCEAKAFFADARIGKAAEASAAQCLDLVLKVAIGGSIAGFEPYEGSLAPFDGSDIADPERGYTMLYTSGTTGRPKGVYKPGVIYGAFQPEADRENDIYLCTGPAYHAAPLAGNVRGPLMNGLPIVFLDRWDSEGVLRIIEERRITHSHFVPIMFQRLLALPEAVRARYDLSSLKRINHGAAPCPPEVKRAMIEWLGPVLSEYYAGSEGGAGFTITSHEWLTKPGTVGRRPHPDAAKIIDDAGEECPPGVAGTIYMRVPAAGFQYYKDEKKTQASRLGDYFTLGDVGYLDEDDYLFLTGRSAETIIAGGVNIYPQEVDNELIKHPAVEDSCTIGVPHAEYGEEVRAVIQLKAGFEPSEAMRAEILAFAVASLARFKIPRGLDFVEELPRSAAGKILRNRVREPYWAGRARQI